MEAPPDWFWNILDSTRPSLAALETWLVNAPKEQLEEFANVYELAAQSLCDYWDGPLVDNLQYSEDDTEDLCNWVVSQGRELWQRVRAGDIDIGCVASILSKGEFHLLPVPTEQWSTEVSNPKHRGYQDPALIAMGVYFTRFGMVWPG
jgi:hypothetical protein